MEIVVEYTFPLDEEEQSKVLRLSLHEASLMDMSHYRKLIEEGRQWFKERHGVDFINGEAEDNLDEAEYLVRRAEILAVLPRRGDEYLGEWQSEDGESWELAPLPREWTDLDTFMEAFPASLFNGLSGVTRTLNAGAFWSVPDFLAQTRLQITRRP